MKKIKTRFSPSSTGHLHIGGARTALYAWLFARNMNGKFVLRIEDTDCNRSKELFSQSIINSLKWLNLNWDEGPFFQSKRLDRYKEIVENMISKKIAYKCYCSKDRIEKLRKSQIMKGEKPRYDGYCREKKYFFNNKKSFSVRFKNPKSGIVIFKDMIYKTIKFSNKELDDLVILRTDGTPTYNFCTVVDDYDMEITHVIRGAEHINNTPRQINIMKSIGIPIPYYGHVPIILDTQKKKLSKRYGAKNILQYRREGFFSSAILNYLIRLGWSYGNKEIFNLDEMKSLFNLENISKSPSIFDLKKMLWINHYYMNHLPKEFVEKELRNFMKEKNINLSNGPNEKELFNLMRKRCKTMQEILNNSIYFYNNLENIQILNNQYSNTQTVKILEFTKKKLKKNKLWKLEVISSLIKEIQQELNLSIKEIGMPIRIAITGTDNSPALRDIIFYIGKQRCLNRIDTYINSIINKKV